MPRFLAAVAIFTVLVFALAACSSDDDGDDGSATATVTQKADDAGDDLDADATLLAEAQTACPAEFLNSCSETYVLTASSSLPSALCVSSAGFWFMETPG